MRNEEEKRSITETGKSGVELAKERLQTTKAKIGLGVLGGMIVLSILAHFFT